MDSTWPQYFAIETFAAQIGLLSVCIFITPRWCCLGGRIFSKEFAECGLATVHNNRTAGGVVVVVVNNRQKSLMERADIFWQHQTKLVSQGPLYCVTNAKELGQLLNFYNSYLWLEETALKTGSSHCCYDFLLPRCFTDCKGLNGF